MTEKLYNYGFICADIHHETEDQCQTRIIAALELVPGIARAERVSHMIAMDQIGEISLTVFIEQGTDLDDLEDAISKIPGIKYQDLTEELVLSAPAQAVPACGQPGHQCVCGTKTPKPE